MKKSTKIALAAAMFASAAALTSCGGESSSNASSIYGKVPKVTPPASSAAYDPSEDEPQDVYGPGPDYEEPDDTQDENSPADDVSAEPEYVPQVDDVPTVYGPPADMDN